MLYEIFKFELYYRLKRPETYLFFGFLLLISIFAVDFVFEGVDLGLVKKNAPIVTAKAMSSYTGIFMILVSMIMGMPIVRDDQHQITPLLYTTPIHKSDLLIGRFMGSLVILLLIFCGIPIGMMIGEFMPWRLESAMGTFKWLPYLNSYALLIVPSLFFGGSLFFVTGALSRNLLVVYTQGIVLFVTFILTKSITNEYLQAVLDPFSLTTTSYITEQWSVSDKNTLLMPFGGVLLINKLFWTILGIIALVTGYWRFSFSTKNKSQKTSDSIPLLNIEPWKGDIDLTPVVPQYGWMAQLYQWKSLSYFYCKSLLKETSFWAIVICAVIILIVNSINLGTVYDVDSYPTSYFIIAELQEMSFYFFTVIMLFYSGELYSKEPEVSLDQMSHATPISSIVVMSSKISSLIGIYIILMIALICSGVIFQVSQGYYHIDLHVYFVVFFIEILPILVLYTIAAFFFQALVHHKFIGILMTILFIAGTVAMQGLHPEHLLINYASGSLGIYSEMNGFGHFWPPYILSQLYWGLVSLIIVIAASLLSVRGVSKSLIQRSRTLRSDLTQKQLKVGGIVIVLIAMTGSYIYHKTFVLNEVWPEEKQMSYRAHYEKALKHLEFVNQPKIIETNLALELYPSTRSYHLSGEYTLQNHSPQAISEIHIQKQINPRVSLTELQFSTPVAADSQYQAYDYIIYQLEQPLAPDESVKMSFVQQLSPQGWDLDQDVGPVLYNGSFIRNNEFPTLGYHAKYELRDSIDRVTYDLPKRPIKAHIDDSQELLLPRSGSDSRGVKTNIVIGTSSDQTAITSGNLVDQWQSDNRNYYRYLSDTPIIDFYAMLSGDYVIKKDLWSPLGDTTQSVDLEIYHHPRHNYNLDRMMKAMKASLDYYSTQFTPYQYDQLRIVEFPRYQDFAQSFPNTIPFSEAIGFMLDIDDEQDVDMAFFITAHEVAHQWWGMQVEAAHVQGQNFILETLSQYSALMVLKQHYQQDKVDQFLNHQQERYELGKRKATAQEVPLCLVSNEDHIYYNKGAIVMYDIQELIGEQELNCALQSFIHDWNSVDGRLKSQTKRYATSEDLVQYILNYTPKELQPQLKELLCG